MNWAKCFTEHPATVGETYGEHMQVSLSYAVPLTKAAAAAYLHALMPFLFTTTASGIVKGLYDRMTRRCSSCVHGPKHRPDLFVRSVPSVPQREPMLAWDPVI